MIRLLIALAFLLFAQVAPLGAEEGVFLREDVQLHVADTFLAEGEYYRAVTEFKRFLILFPGSARADYALFQIGSAYYRGGEYRQAAQTFAVVGAQYPVGEHAAAAAFYEGLSNWKQGLLGGARAAFDRVAADSPKNDFAPLAMVGKSLIAFDEGDTAGYREGLERVRERFPTSHQSVRAAEALAALDRNGEPPHKSPALAGVMSALLPGSGYIYAGHYSDGVVAFTLNALFIAGTVVAAADDNFPVAAIVAGVGLPFYLGNIYGSANAAKNWNVGVRRDLRGQLAVILDFRY